MAVEVKFIIVTSLVFFAVLLPLSATGIETLMKFIISGSVAMFAGWLIAVGPTPVTRSGRFLYYH